MFSVASTVVWCRSSNDFETYFSEELAVSDFPMTAARPWRFSWEEPPSIAGKKEQRVTHSQPASSQPAGVSHPSIAVRVIERRLNGLSGISLRFSCNESAGEVPSCQPLTSLNQLPRRSPFYYSAALDLLTLDS